MVICCYVSDIGKCLIFNASCSTDRHRHVLTCVHSGVFYLSVSVGIATGESVFTVFRRRRMENAVNLLSLHL